MELSIIIVNFNSMKYLLECVASIYEWTCGLQFEILVVDNASPNRDIDQLKAHFADVRLIQSSHNLGFAGANNVGFQHSTGEFVVFLNPDTCLISPAFSVMIETARALKDLGVVGCRLLNTDLSIQTSSVMKFPTIMNSILQVEHFRLKVPSLFGIGPLFSDKPGPVSVEAISGACMLLPRSVFVSVGMFDEQYFMYSEDVDLCYKVAKAGLKAYYCGDVSIVHHGGKTSPPTWQTVMKTKAELRFLEKVHGRLYRSLFQIAAAINASSRWAIFRAGVGLLQMCGKPDCERAREKAAKWSAVWNTVVRTHPIRRVCSSPPGG